MADIQFLSEHLTHRHGHSDEDEEDDIQKGSDGDDDDEDDEDDEDENATMTSAASPDPTLPIACNLERFAESENTFNRQMVARSLLDTLRSVVHVEDDVATVLSVLLRLSEDIEPSVRAELAEQVPHIAAFCRSYTGKGLEEVLPRYLLPLIVRYLADPNNQVRKTGQSALLSLLEQELLGPEELEDQVCPIVLQLADPESLDHYRTEAVTLMSRMATLLGKDMAQTLFLDRFVALCSDGLFQVRKVCAIHFGDFCSVMEGEITESILLPRFALLCNDGMWGVRKVCADVFVAVAYVCSMLTRQQHLAPLFVSLLSDQSRWVRMAAFQALGPFISTFATPGSHNLCYDEDGNVYVNVQPCEEENRPDEIPVSQDSLDEPSDSIRPTHDPEEKTVVELEDENHSRHVGGDSGFASRETSNVGSPAEEEEEEDEDDEQDKSALQSSHKWDDEKAIEFSPDSAAAGIQRLHVGHHDCFNSFHYWRDPIPDIELDIDLVEGRPAGIHVRSVVYCGPKRLTFSSELNVEVRDVQQCDNTETALKKVTLVQRRDGDDGGEQVILRLESPPSLNQTPADLLQSRTTVLTSQSSDALFPRSSLLHPEMVPCVSAAIGVQDIVPQALLDQYVSMTDPAHLQTMDSEIVRYCAHSLPAVTLALGRQHWPLLRQLYESLASDMQWKVRRTLAFSIHELAAILGKDIAALDLVPVFNSFIRDLDEVRIGILRHLARFLSLLPIAERNSYLPKLQEFLEPENERNWRFRLELAKQLSMLSHLFATRDVAIHLLPVAVRLLQDRISEVRTTAASTLANLVFGFFNGRKCAAAGGAVRHKKTEHDFREFLVSLANSLVSNFARHSKWQHRQTFANVCCHLKYCFPTSLFIVHLLPALLELSGDQVANVRLVVAKVFSQTISRSSAQVPVRETASVRSFHEFLTEDIDDKSSERESVCRALERLRNDRDRDVRQAAFGRLQFPQLSECLSFPSVSGGSVMREEQLETKGPVLSEFPPV